MSLNLVPEDTLRAALAPHRVDPQTFEAAVRERAKSAETERAASPLEDLSPRLKGAAAFLPLEILAGSKVTGITAQMAPATACSKLVAYLAFPAISVFVLLGATLFSFAKIRSIQQGKGPAILDEPALNRAIGQWWHRHRWGAALVYGSTFGLSLLGATWLMFVVYIISFGLLVYALASLAKFGLGNRLVIGQSCLWGLIFLAQAASSFEIGDAEIHFVDQTLVSAVFYVGVLLLLVIVLGSGVARTALRRFPSDFPGVRAALGAVLAVGLSLCAAVIIVPMIAGWIIPVLRPMPRSDIKHYVESFDEAPFSAASWDPWEIVARWAIDAKLAPDFSRPRRLLAKEIAGEQNRFVLGSALRLGLLRTDELSQLKEYEKQRRSLFDDPGHLLERNPIGSLEQFDWVIRAAVLRNDLSPVDRDELQKRLNDNLEDLPGGPFSNEVLLTALRATQLLKVIDRPVDLNHYRKRVHDWLRQHHTTSAGGFQRAGGFKTYPNLGTGDPQATAHAVELMEIYGIPDGLDLNWVRSYLRPSSLRIPSEKWITAVTLDRLNHLPGATPPTWLEILYYERNLIAATILVGLCLYATLSSPVPKLALPD